MVWRKGKGIEAQVVQTCEEERGNLYWTENAGDATTGEEAKRTTKAEVYGLNKRRYKKAMGLFEEDTKNWVRWTQHIRCGDP